MKKKVTKMLTSALAATMLFSAAGALPANASENDTVRVIVKNERMAAEDGAPWVGTLLDTEIALNGDDSMESVAERAIKNGGYDFTVSEYGYISSVNGLAEYAYQGSGGWMATLNDWFTADGTASYTVENGGLQAGDEIVLQYTCAWGADVGSLYGNYDTSLASLAVDGASVSKNPLDDLSVFDSSEKAYTVIMHDPEDVLSVFATAVNKNYQVRVYKNDYQPETNGAEYRGGRNIPVADGDTLYIGVGNPAWPSMNSWGGTAEETVYALTVRYEVLGDLDGNGVLDIQDATFLQRCLAEFEELSEAQTRQADVDGDGSVTIDDVTSMQRILADR